MKEERKWNTKNKERIETKVEEERGKEKKKKKGGEGALFKKGSDFDE